MATRSWAQCDGAAAPAITAAPRRINDTLNGRALDVPDALSLARVLLTAVPESLQQIAATNLPSASQILWSEFLDGSRPSWFVALPTDIQSYLVRQFAPNTASASPTNVFPSAYPSGFPSAVPSDLLSSIIAPSDTPQITTGPQSSTLSSESSSVPESSQSSNRDGSSGTARTTTRPPTTKFITSIVTVSASTGTASTARASQSTTVPDAPAATFGDPGMSQRTKIAIGVAVPLSVLALAAFVLGCCFLLRRRRKRRARSTDSPGPDFIPRSAFDQRSALNSWDETRALHDGGRYPSTSPSVDSLPGSGSRSSSDENVRPEMTRKISPQNVLHTHTSKRGRGKRTSYQSLQSVPEDPEHESGESSLSRSPPISNRMSPLESIGLPAPTKSQIKRKPVGGSKKISPPLSLGNSMGKAKRVDSLGLLDEEEDIDLQANEYDLSAGRIPSSGNDSPYLEDYGPEYSRGYDDTDGFFQARPDSFEQGKPAYPKTEWPW